MPNTSTLSRTFTKVIATLEIMESKVDCFIRVSDCFIRVTQSFVLFLGLNCFCGSQTNTLHQLYMGTVVTATVVMGAAEGIVAAKER